MAGMVEFSIDLAKKAIEDCLDKSKYIPEDIDLLICCNISRFDGPDHVTFEPSTSVRLRHFFGFSNAIVYDISNACAGMFTGIYLANAMLEAGVINRAMVVSGEYITHLTKAAQKEITGFMDSRLACLTLGDAGVALILERGTNDQTGFQGIELQTYGRYSQYCIAKISELGKFIMHTDSVNLTDVAVKSGATYAVEVLGRAGWLPDKFHHLILHQTSKLTMVNARNEINNLFKNEILHHDNSIDNLEERGNTASTSHFVAIADQIRNKRINSGDKIVFSISASGLTTGTALYVFDDLPDRIRQMESSDMPATKRPAQNLISTSLNNQLPGIKIESIGILPENYNHPKESLEMLHQVSKACLEKSCYARQDIGVLIYTGVYRNEYLLEPAYATLLAGRLDLNAGISVSNSQKTLAFDIFNGALGFLNACYQAQQLLATNKCDAAMIVAAEIENNAEHYPDHLMGLQETASSVILDKHPNSKKGFSKFFFSYHTESVNAYQTTCDVSAINPFLDIKISADVEDRYIESLHAAIQEFIQKEGFTLSQVDLVFPPQISTDFISKLSLALSIPLEKFINAVGEGKDLFSSSIPYGMNEALEKGIAKEGDLGLVLAVGSGIQAGCALYYF
jgi:3-oxoacyl-[acyl-carrier-protein] synthase III